MVHCREALFCCGRGSDWDIMLLMAFPERAGRARLFFPFPRGVGNMAEGPQERGT